MHSHPVKQPNLTRKFPLTDMPTGPEKITNVGVECVAGLLELFELAQLCIAAPAVRRPASLAQGT